MPLHIVSSSHNSASALNLHPVNAYATALRVSGSHLTRNYAVSLHCVKNPNYASAILALTRLALTQTHYVSLSHHRA